MSIVTTFRKYGMMLSTLYIRHCDKAQIVKIINTCDFKRINNVYPRAIRNIYFYVGALHSFSGGITSILRLGSILSEMGRKIFYIGFAIYSMILHITIGTIVRNLFQIMDEKN